MLRWLNSFVIRWWLCSWSGTRTETTMTKVWYSCWCRSAILKPFSSMPRTKLLNKNNSWLRRRNKWWSNKLSNCKGGQKEVKWNKGILTQHIHMNSPEHMARNSLALREVRSNIKISRMGSIPMKLGSATKSTKGITHWFQIKSKWSQTQGF